MPLGATPLWPWRKSNIGTPMMVAVTLACWYEPETLGNCLSKAARDAETPEANTLPVPTQAGSGISVIMWLVPSEMSTW